MHNCILTLALMNTILLNQCCSWHTVLVSESVSSSESSTPCSFVCRSGSLMFVCKSHVTLSCQDRNIAFDDDLTRLSTCHGHEQLFLHLVPPICPWTCCESTLRFSPYALIQRHSSSPNTKRLCRHHQLCRKRCFLGPVCVSLSSWNLQWRTWFVLPRCVKGTVNVYESIGYHVYIEDWSVASSLSSISHEGSPYVLVKWGHDPYDPHDLLLQMIIGHTHNFGCPNGPSGQNRVLPLRAGELHNGIRTLRSHHYILPDEGFTEEIKRQTFSNHWYVPHRHKVLKRGLLDQSVRDFDNFTFPLTPWHTWSEWHTDYLLFSLLLLGVATVDFLSHHEESGLHRTIIFLALHVANLWRKWDVCLPCFEGDVNQTSTHVRSDVTTKYNTDTVWTLDTGRESGLYVGTLFCSGSSTNSRKYVKIRVFINFMSR